MNNNEIENILKQRKDIESILMNIEEETEDKIGFDFDFKPITSGLGFNKENATKVVNRIQKSHSVDNKVTSTAIPKNIVSAINNKTVDSTIPSIPMGNLSVIYAEKDPSIESVNSSAMKPQSIDKRLNPANFGVIMMSQLVDVVLAGIMSMGLMTVLFYLLDLKFSDYILNSEYLSLFFGFYFCNFIIYSISFELSSLSSLGKMIFKISYKTQGGDKILSLSKLFILSVFEFINVFTFGLIELSDLRSDLLKVRLYRDSKY